MIFDLELSSVLLIVLTELKSSKTCEHDQFAAVISGFEGKSGSGIVDMIEHKEPETSWYDREFKSGNLKAKEQNISHEGEIINRLN